MDKNLIEEIDNNTFPVLRETTLNGQTLKIKGLSHKVCKLKITGVGLY